MKNEKLAEKALAILNQKSEKALKKAKELILKERFRCQKAREALKYYVSTWNDITRPGVLALAHEAVGGKPREVIPLQTAMLFIDAAMDIHDDIIDKSTIKGLKKTLYGKFGEETALLIGNAFLVKGFNQLYKTTERLPLNRKQRIIDAVKSFLFEVIDAHIQENILASNKWEAKSTEYLKILEQKSADLEGHMCVGAIFGGGSTQEIKALGTYGKHLGILLTIRSDFIDIYEPDELRNRVKHECLPLPLLYSLENEVSSSKVRQILSKEEIGEDEANELLEIIYSTPYMSALKNYMKNAKQKALKSLRDLSKGKIRDILTFFIDSALEDL